MIKYDGNKDIIEDLQFFKNKLKNKEPFSYCKFSDGELYIMENKEVILGPEFKNHNYKDDIDWKHFTPNKDEKVRQKLIDSMKYHNDNYYIGIYGANDASAEKIHIWMKRFCERDEHYLTWTNVFVCSQYPLFKKEIVPEFNNYPIIMVCNKKSTFNNAPFKDNIVKTFYVGTNCIINDFDLIETIKNYIKENNIKNHLFLMAASSLANMMCYEFNKIEPENTYFDVGATLNVYLGLSMDRSYLASGENIPYRGRYMGTFYDNKKEYWSNKK